MKSEGQEDNSARKL